MIKQNLAVFGTAVLLTFVPVGPSFSGSTIGGNPTNGGGQTFSAPSPATTLEAVVGGQAVVDAIASGNPAQVETALLAAVTANFPGGVGSADLDPLPGQTGAQTVAILTNLIQKFAANVKLPLNSPAIQQLLQIAQTAIS